MVRDNIALKDGDYPGNMDVTRFRESITNQVQYLENVQSGENYNEYENQ